MYNYFCIITQVVSIIRFSKFILSVYKTLPAETTTSKLFQQLEYIKSLTLRIKQFI